MEEYTRILHADIQQQRQTQLVVIQPLVTGNFLALVVLSILQQITQTKTLLTAEFLLQLAYLAGFWGQNECILASPCLLKLYGKLCF